MKFFLTKIRINPSLSVPCPSTKTWLPTVWEESPGTGIPQESLDLLRDTDKSCKFFRIISA